MRLSQVSKELAARGQVHDDLAEVLKELSRRGDISGFVISVVQGDSIKTTCDGLPADLVGSVRFCVRTMTSEALADEVANRLATHLMGVHA